MLRTLRINNYALIDQLEIDFSSGLNVLTGETGAGKSIIVGAISLLIGGRSQTEYIRDKSVKTSVEGYFELELNEDLSELLAEMGISADEDYLVLRREINPNGKSSARINGVTVQVSFLKNFASRVLNIYGQHDFQILSDPGNHLTILDNIGLNEIQGIKEKVSLAFDELESIRKKTADIKNKLDTEQSKKEFLAFQLEELEKANLEDPLEDLEIDQELRVLENQERINQLILKSAEDLYGQNSAYGRVGSALDAVGELTEYLDKLKNAEERLQSIYYDLEDIVLELKQYSEDEDYNPKRLDYLNERKFQLQRLKKKYNLTLEELILKKQEMEKELELFSNLNYYLEEAEKELSISRENYEKAAMELRKKRKYMASQIEEKILTELSYLGMKNIIFKTLFFEVPPSKQGSDKAEFLISTNLGEELKPIARIASGGEMSRIMLSLKVIMTNDGIGTMIFDEIDSGIGGETIVKVAQKLAQVAEKKQVLCVTHAPQVAAVADQHFGIEKMELEGKTQTGVKVLGSQEKIEELSRMLGDKSEAGKEFAKKIIGK